MAENLSISIDAAKIEIARIVEDCTLSSKGHFNASDTWLRRHYWIGIPATLFGAATGTAIIKNASQLAIFLSLSATILTALITFLRPSERASSHKAAGDEYLSLKNDSRIFSELQLLNATKGVAISDAVMLLNKRRNSLNQRSPIIPRTAFVKARNGIREGEATHEIDERNKPCQ